MSDLPYFQLVLGFFFGSKNVQEVLSKFSPNIMLVADQIYALNSKSPAENDLLSREDVLKSTMRRNQNANHNH